MKILANAMTFSKLRFVGKNNLRNINVSQRKLSTLSIKDNLANPDKPFLQFPLKNNQISSYINENKLLKLFKNIENSNNKKTQTSTKYSSQLEQKNHNINSELNNSSIHNNYNKNELSFLDNFLSKSKLKQSNYFLNINQLLFTKQNNSQLCLFKTQKAFFCVLRESASPNKKRLEKTKKKFNREITSQQQSSSKLLLVEKNITASIDSNISQEIKSELDSGIKMFTEIEKDEKTPMSKVDAYYYMKNIDAKFESFFHNREFSLKTFNYYMQVLGSQAKLGEMEQNLLKMREMGILPSLNTYVILMNAYAKAKNISECERIFAIIKKISKGNVNMYTYNTLLLAYAKNGLVNQSEAIINEMTRNGLQPDSACYTTLIHAYKKSGDYAKCWELYDECQFRGKVDEFLVSYMIKLAGHTKNPEKALLLYEYFELEGFNHYTINFNSLLFALTSTKKYAEKALEVFQKMKMKNVMPDSYTYVCMLRATAHLGDINTANELIKEMKLMNLPMNEYVCNGLIRTFAGAARIPYVKSEHLVEYLKDAWNIFGFMEKNEMKISVQILDSLLEVHCIMHKTEEVDGLVLPLYEKYGFDFSLYTYEKLSQMLLDLRNYDRVVKIYETLLEKSKQKGFYELSDRVLNNAMETGIRTNDCDLIVSCLKNFGNIKAKPQRSLLRTLAGMENLPDSLFVELRNWVDSDKIGRKFRAFSPAQIRERSSTPPPNKRRRGRKIK